MRDVRAFLLSVAFAICMALAASQTAFAETRVALVIGNGAYRNVPRLPNPANDAAAVSVALKRAGFDTIVATDLDKSGMEQAAIRFARAARNAEVAMFYYSGHALQFAGVNYLAPVDAELTDEADLRLMVKVDDIVSDLQQAKSLRILVLDACRNNPLADNLKRSIGKSRAIPLQRGLAKIDSPEGMIVAYATQAGHEAEDGQGHNSPYTTAFLGHIDEQEEIGTIFRKISFDVYEATKHQQLPELSLSLIGEFYLRDKPAASAKPAIVAPPAPSGPAADEIAWGFLSDSTSPAALRRFTGQFPASAHRTDAETRIAALESRVTDIQRKADAERPKAVAPAVPQRPVSTAWPTPVQPPLPPQQVAVIAPPVKQGAPCGKGTTLAALSSRATSILSDDEECALKPKDAFQECRDCPQMIVMPPGSFTMGSINERGGSDERRRSVTFARSFAVGRFAVTFDEWDACVTDGGCNGYRPSDERWGRGRRPVINISWNDAKAYVEWLSRKTGRIYRLLSESEREYVTRAGTTTAFWWGSSITSNQANYNAHYAYDGGGGVGEFRGMTLPVDSFAPNPWGLYQVHGNVSEWVEDCYQGSYADAPSDGSALNMANCQERAIRGGDWRINPDVLRAARRDEGEPQSRYNYRGFRVARTLR